MTTITASFQSGVDTPLVTPANAPTIRIRRTDTQALVVTDAAMTEQGDGVFAYDFTPSASLDYSIRADGDPTASGQTIVGGRYAFGGLSGETEAAEDTIATNLDAQVSLVETEASAAAREVTNTAEHAATLAAVGLNETEIAAAAREATNTAEHAATLAAIGALPAPTTPAAIATYLETTGPNPHGTGAWDATATVPPQTIRDALKLAPSGGAPAAGSIDALIALVETEIAAAAREVTNTAEHAATLAAVGLVETEASAAAREVTNTAEHAATLAAVGALAFATPADLVALQAALEAYGDANWITAVGFETEASAATREATNTAEHAATLAAIGALPAPGLTAAQATQLAEAWTLLGANIAAPVSFDAAALFVQALAAGIDIAIGIVGTTVTLTRQP